MLTNLMVNKMKTKFLIIAGAVIALGMNSAVSYAEDVESITPRGEKVFAKIDANGDGKIDYAEYTSAKDKFHQKRQTNHMQRMDVDKDGFISANEFSHWGEQMQQQRKGKKSGKGAGKKGGYMHEKFSGNTEQMLARCDYNKDGKVDKTEMQQLLSDKVDKIFDKKDKNKDGFLTKDEMVPKTMEQRFAEHDLNGDGKIDQSEMDKSREEKSKRHFEMKDKNNDKYLDQSEFGQRKWKRGQRRGNMK